MFGHRFCYDNAVFTKLIDEMLKRFLPGEKKQAFLNVSMSQILKNVKKDVINKECF